MGGSEDFKASFMTQPKVGREGRIGFGSQVHLRASPLSSDSIKYIVPKCPMGLQ